MPNSEEHSGEIPELPARLREDLSALYRRTPAVPPSVDAAILAAGRSAFGRQRQIRFAIRWGGGAAVAAAVVLLGVRVAATFHLLSPHPSYPANIVAYAREDLLHRGRVDILDAYYLARQIQNHAPLPPQWDVNGDGVVDQKDVDAIAAVAVSVEPKGGMR